MGFTNFPNGITSFGAPIFGQGFPAIPRDGQYWFVDGTNGASGNSGKNPKNALTTIQAAINKASPFDVIVVFPQMIPITATDPVSYAETIIIPNTLPGLSIIGVSHGRTQGGLPQIKKGSGSTALLTIRAPSCLIANLGINGASSTGGGILLDDNGTTKVAFGTSIVGCHFKNCVNSGSAVTGGAIQWSSSGGAWQTYIARNRFYKNVGGIVVIGTGGSVPADVIIEDNVFGGAGTEVDCDIYVGGSGAIGLVIRNNEFGVVDVPAWSGAGSVNLYVKLLAGSRGIVTGNRFACTGKTFGDNAGVNAAFWPTTVRAPFNYQENAIITRTS